jgi:hypothetical protein
MKVRTNYQHGHWVAVDDDTHYYSDDPLGQGRTEAEAIEDLLEQLAKREERREARLRQRANY